jgi:hypothetical protein
VSISAAGSLRPNYAIKSQYISHQLCKKEPMEYLFTSLAVIFVGVVIFLSIRLRKSNQNIHQLQERYKSITNADQYIEKIKEESRIEINKKESALSEIEIKLSQVKESIIENEGKIIAAKERALQIIKEESQAIINEKQKILSGIELQITNIQNISKVDARKAIEDKESNRRQGKVFAKTRG